MISEIVAQLCESLGSLPVFGDFLVGFCNQVVSILQSLGL